MDLNVRNELPKIGQDTRYIIEQQRILRDKIRKETEECEERLKYLLDKTKEIEDRIFTDQMGSKIKELVKENLKLSTDALCLSIHLDIQNNKTLERRAPENIGRHRSPIYLSPGHPMSGNSSPIPSTSRGHTPTNPHSNVVTLDTSSYPYAQVVQLSPPQSHSQSPYPVQAPFHYPVRANGQHLDPNRQISPSILHPNYYGYERHGSLNILNQVPPPGNMVSNNYPLYPGPPVPPRPTDLNIPSMRSRPTRTSLPSIPTRPVPPPPTTPKPSRSSNVDRQRSPNDPIEQVDEEEFDLWECRGCTFRNHSAMSSCEMCNTARVISLGNDGVGTSSMLLSPPLSPSKLSSSKRHYKNKKPSKRHHNRDAFDQ